MTKGVSYPAKQISVREMFVYVLTCLVLLFVSTDNKPHAGKLRAKTKIVILVIRMKLEWVHDVISPARGFYCNLSASRAAGEVGAKRREISKNEISHYVRNDVTIQTPLSLASS